MASSSTEEIMWRLDAPILPFHLGPLRYKYTEEALFGNKTNEDQSSPYPGAYSITSSARPGRDDRYIRIQ